MRRCIVSLLLLAAAGQAGAAQPTRDPSYAAAARAVEQRARAPVPKQEARNVILFVGDGMGVTTVTAARILEGQAKGGPGEENALSFERFPYSALSKTYTVDMQVSESAGTMVAMVSGLKTLGGVLGLAPVPTQGDCAAVQAASVPTLLEQAEDAGLATGIVSTARITHATPAATYAHVPERDWEWDGAMPAGRVEQGCRDIARQLVEFDHGDGIDVILGGGRAMFFPATAADPEDEGATGARADGRDLVAEWVARNPDAVFAWRSKELDAAPARTMKLFGLFERSHMEFEADRATDVGGEPSLAEMTEKAIRLLRRDRDGYFLVVEGGRIDHGHHAGNAHRALTDTIAFSDAIAVADRLTDEDDTLIIVTADHSHTLSMAGYPARGSPILGKAQAAPDVLMKDGAGLPYTTLSYANGPGALQPSNQQPAGIKRYPHLASQFTNAPVARPDLTEVDTTAADYLQESQVPLSSETHGGEDVPIYARGPGAHLVRGVMEQNEIYHVMRRALKRIAAR